MPSITWGTGTDIFAADYLSAQVPNSGSTQWQSSDIYDHKLSALEYKNITAYFEDAPSTAMSDRTDANTPLNRVTEGASPGYYRTVSYKSQPAENPYFTQNILMYDRHIITNVSDIQRLVWKPTITKSTITITPIGGSSQSVTKYSISPFESGKVSIFKKNDYEHYTTTDIDIVPAIIAPLRTNALQAFPFWGTDMDYASWVDSLVYRYDLTYGSNRNNQKRFLPEFEGLEALPNSDNETTVYAISKNGRYLAEITYRAGDKYSYMTNTYAHVKYYCISEDEFLYILASSGLKFEYNSKLYKPVAENGVIVGYTDDMDKESEWDNWHDYTDHEVPITPPAPGGDDDDPWHGIDFGGTGAGGGGAFCSVYYMTGAELTSLKNWGQTSSPEGFDMLPSIIGLHQVPVALSGISTTVKFLKSAAITQQGEARLVDTGVSAGTGTGQPIDFSLGSVNIDRRMQQRGEPYLDYDSTVELYLPFAGVFQLDVQAVMGKTISAKITLDPVNGTVFAYAWVENGGEKMPIAYGGGPIAVSLPVSSNQWGLSRAAAQQMKHQQIQNVLNIAKDAVLSWAGGKMAQNINRMGFSTNVDAQIAQYGTTQGLKYQSVQQGSNIIESTANTVQGIHNLVQLNNTNYTAVNGSFGGSYAEWSQPFTAYVRITRPKFQKPSNYNHTQAVPCVEAKTVGSCTGLVQCINPDIDSIPCTQTEKVLITNALVNGVYAGGGGQ